MFLNIDQQLARCERVIRQRVRPHIHRTIEPLSIEAFDIPGEPMPATDFSYMNPKAMCHSDRSL